MSRFNSDNASKRLEQLRRVLKTPLSLRTIKSSSSPPGTNNASLAGLKDNYYKLKGRT